jgi:hypothetical protein
MEEIFTRIAENLMGRIHGPLTFRFLIQPAVAIFLATKAGLFDARQERSPYFWALLYDPSHRRDMLRQGWRDVSKVFVLAVILDIVYQLIVLRWVYPGEALIVAIALAFLPYLLFRGLVTRVARMFRRTHPPEPTGTPP